MSRLDFDALVSGGGIAGATAAALLARGGRRVGLVDPKPPEGSLPEDDFDPRVVAISPGSARILAAAGAWQRLDAGRMAAFDVMSVHSGRQSTTFRASDHGLEALGWIVEIPALRQALWRALEHDENLTLLAPGTVETLDTDPKRARVKTDQGRTIHAGLVVAADGARSPLRRMAGIEVDTWHYNQNAIVAPVTNERSNRGVAWQRFTEHGPLALLPLADGRSSIVWSVPSGVSESLLALDEAGFVEALNEHQDSPFGPVLQAGTRHALPLVRRRAQRLVQGRLVLLGDAARSVHPLAGQGMNLGLADAAALAEALEATGSDNDPGPALAHYERWRLSAGSLISDGIHGINEIAHTPGSLGRGLLGLGFGVASRLWPLRQAFVEHACGIDSDSPRLARP